MRCLEERNRWHLCHLWHFRDGLWGLRNGTHGIDASLACAIKNNSVYGNTEDNNEVTTDCLVTNNTSTSAGFNAGDGAGIHVTGSRNRIEGINVGLSDRGVQVGQANNVIRNNSVTRNPTSGTPANYNIAAGNQVEILLTFIPETINIPATITLSGDLTGVSGSSGLTIAADNVTVDLAGHALVGVAGSADGIVVSGSRANLAIKNGTVRSWGGDGIDASTSVNGQFDRLQIDQQHRSRHEHRRPRARHGLHGETKRQPRHLWRNHRHRFTLPRPALNSGFGISVSGYGPDRKVQPQQQHRRRHRGRQLLRRSRQHLRLSHRPIAAILVTGTDNRLEATMSLATPAASISAPPAT